MSRAWSTNRHGARAAGGRAIGLVDIGTSKVACLIVEPSATGWRIVGAGHQRSRGLKAGVVTDIEAAEQALRAAVGQAERAAGLEIAEVYVSVACGRLRSQNFAAHADVETGVVTDNDIARAMAGGRAYAERDGRMLVHLNRYGFRLDGNGGMRDPRNMAAERLAADLHAVTTDEAPLRNLLLVVERCYLSVAGIVAGPYASALAATSEEERRLGVTAIDFGAGTISIACFADGQLIHCDVMPVGANHITFDIARGLQTPLAEAERIKALYATLAGAPSDEHEIFSYPLTGEDDDGVTGHTTRSELAKIVRPRVAGLIAQLGERLERSGMRAFTGERIVLTGGGSGLVGIGPFAANALGRPVRVAPAPVWLPANVASPAFACVAGIYAAVASGLVVQQVGRCREAVAANGYLGRVGQWLKDGF